MNLSDGKNTGKNDNPLDIENLTKNLTGMLNTFSKISKMDENNKDNNNSSDADAMLNVMIKEIGNITNIVGDKVKEVTETINNDPNFEPEDKKQYLDITSKIKKLTDAISQMGDNPDSAEKAINDIMGSFKNDMGIETDLTKEVSNNNIKDSNYDAEEEIEDLKNRVRKLEKKQDKFREIIDKIMSRVIGTK